MARVFETLHPHGRREEAFGFPASDQPIAAHCGLLQSEPVDRRPLCVSVNLLSKISKYFFLKKEPHVNEAFKHAQEPPCESETVNEQKNKKEFLDVPVNIYKLH